MKAVLITLSLIVGTNVFGQTAQDSARFAKIDTLHEHIYQDRKVISLYTWDDEESTYAGEPSKLGLMVPRDNYYVPRLQVTLSARAMLDTLEGELGEIQGLMSHDGFKYAYADGTPYCLDMQLRRFRERLMRKEMGIVSR